MVAIGQGATEAVQKQISSMGQNQLTILPGSTSSGAVMMGGGTAQTLTPADATSIARECPSANAVAIIVRARAQIVYQELNWAPSVVQGSDTGFFSVREWEVVEGEAFTESDVQNAAQVCLVGQTVAENLFRDESPVGKRIRLKGLPFRILGVLDRKGANTFGIDQDDILLLPWTTVKKKLQGSAFSNVDQILVTARSAEDLPSLEEEIRATLRANHRLDREAGSAALDDFTIRNMAELLGAMTAATGVMTLLLAAIASISLLVGGIGIMNIMLVSVTERTREIEQRMAVGARARDVHSQFLVESVVLSGFGGVIGIGLGCGIAIGVSRLANWNTIISPEAIAAAVLFSGAVGVIFGFYPAWRASRLDPIEALRYE